MTSESAVYQGLTAEEAELLESIINADTVVDAHVAGLETLLERNADGTLGLTELRHLRLACERMRELLGKCEKSPAARARAAR